MTVLKRRKVSKTNLEVTELGLGGAPMGGFRATISDAEAVALTDPAYDGGERYFDTSPYYGYGCSELRMGAALRESGQGHYRVHLLGARRSQARAPKHLIWVSGTLDFDRRCHALDFFEIVHCEPDVE